MGGQAIIEVFIGGHLAQNGGELFEIAVMKVIIWISNLVRSHNPIRSAQTG